MKLRTGYAAIGLSPDLGASYFLGRRAGTVKAQQWFMLNETLNAQQCLDHHVVDKLCPNAELEMAATEMALRLANHAPGSMRSIKALFTGLPSRDLQAHLDLEHHFMKQCADSAEAREGVQAFLENAQRSFNLPAEPHVLPDGFGAGLCGGTTCRPSGRHLNPSKKTPQ